VHANIVEGLEKSLRLLMNLSFGGNARKYLLEVAEAEWIAIVGLDFKSRL
jgi:hypothetical protein